MIKTLASLLTTLLAQIDLLKPLDVVVGNRVLIHAQATSNRDFELNIRLVPGWLVLQWPVVRAAWLLFR